MINPFQIINSRLSSIEDLLLDLKHKSKDDLTLKKYNVGQAARINNCSSLTIYNKIKKGQIKAEKFGGKYLILHTELYNSNNQVKSLKYKRDV